MKIMSCEMEDEGLCGLPVWYNDARTDERVITHVDSDMTVTGLDYYVLDHVIDRGWPHRQAIVGVGDLEPLTVLEYVEHVLGLKVKDGSDSPWHISNTRGIPLGAAQLVREDGIYEMFYTRYGEPVTDDVLDQLSLGATHRDRLNAILRYEIERNADSD